MIVKMILIGVEYAALHLLVLLQTLFIFLPLVKLNVNGMCFILLMDLFFWLISIDHRIMREISSIDSLEDELNIFSLDVFGTIMIEYFNVHNEQ